MTRRAASRQVSSSQLSSNTKVQIKGKSSISGSYDQVGRLKSIEKNVATVLSSCHSGKDMENEPAGVEEQKAD